MLLLHAAAGTVALLVGPLALAGVRRAVLPYRVLVLVVAATALLLTGPSSLPAPVLLLLGVVAVASAVAAWAPSERALRGSYVALVAALAFVSAPVWAGAVVVAVGSVLVHAVPVREAMSSAGRGRAFGVR